MAYHKSSESVKKNVVSWTKNLAVKPTRRNMPMIETLSNYVRIPKKKDIIGRYHSLLDQAKDKTTRTILIADELIILWAKLNFPAVTKQTIMSKLRKLMEKQEKNRKRKMDSFKDETENLFDITKIEGEWLCQEDKKLYNLQIESKGKIGYTTNKSAPKSSIHPSKRVRTSSASHTSTNVASHHVTPNEEDETTSIDVESCTSDADSTMAEYSDNITQSKAVLHFSTSHASKLVIRNSLSTNKAAVVCASLADDGISVPTPSQSGVWRAVIRDGNNAKLKLKSIMKEENNFCLHFDGKKIGKHEYQVVCLKSPSREIKLGVLKCESGTAQDIFSSLENLLDEYDAWKNLKMIICDTTSVNTGRLNGVVVKLQNAMISKGFDKPQYIGCQHHILDRVLKHVLEFFNPTSSTKPTLNYKFVDDVVKHYENLQQSYKPEIEMEMVENPGWREDFKFLFELCRAFRFFKENGRFPLIKWHKLPSLHNARWNSRAIYAMIAYFLIPRWRVTLEISSSFIANAWQEAWFSNQRFKDGIYQRLFDAIFELECPGALKCLKTHWNLDKSVVDVPRTNIIAERGIKLMEELYQKCKKDKYLNNKFVAKNKF